MHLLAVLPLLASLPATLAEPVPAAAPQNAGQIISQVDPSATITDISPAQVRLFPHQPLTLTSD